MKDILGFFRFIYFLHYNIVLVKIMQINMQHIIHKYNFLLFLF